MIAGLEFIRSWRFWIMLTASTTAIMLGSAGVHIALTLFLPVMAVEPDPFFSLLGGVAVLFLATGLWFIHLRNKQALHYPKEYRELLSLFIAITSVFVVILEWVAVNWLIVKPIVADAPGATVYSLFVFLFAFSFGQWIAVAEWAAMTGVDSDADRSATPDLP